MRITAHTFFMPKEGNEADEYEDAFAFSSELDDDVELFRCAAADGATETSFSQSWANALVMAYSSGQLKHDRLRQQIKPLQERWWQELSSKSLPWYAQQKVEAGAFSSLLGLTIKGQQQHNNLRWSAVAVGDTCLFHVNHNGRVLAFPITHAEDFNSRPTLISSHRDRNPNLTNKRGSARKTMNGAADAGDVFFLMTDALACWFLGAIGRDQSAWIQVRDLGTDSGTPFDEFTSSLRRDHAMRNDDVTLLRIFVN